MPESGATTLAMSSGLAKVTSRASISVFSFFSSSPVVLKFAPAPSAWALSASKRAASSPLWVFRVARSRSMRTVPDFAASLVSLVVARRESTSCVTLLRSASSCVLIVDSRSTTLPVSAASCGNRPLCGSFAAAVDISLSCSSSFATRASTATSSGRAAVLASTALMLPASSSWRFARRSTLPPTFSRPWILVSVAASREASSGLGFFCFAVASSAMMRCCKAAVASSRSAGPLKLSCEASMSAASRATTPPAMPAARCVKNPP